jgi:hypothetical protein
MDERKYRHDETEAVTERDVRQINILEKSMKSNLLPLTVCGLRGGRTVDVATSYCFMSQCLSVIKRVLDKHSAGNTDNENSACTALCNPSGYVVKLRCTKT